MFLDAATMQIDLSEFEQIPEACRPSSICAVNISASGHVTLNRPLLEEISRRVGTLKLGFACRKQDKSVLLLFPTDAPNYSFPSGGSRKDTRFTQSLVENGIVLPARYEVAWNEAAAAWVGILMGERAADPLASCLKIGKRGRRRAA